MSTKNQSLKLETLSHGTQVLYQWAGWKIEEKVSVALRHVELRKGDRALVVYEYSPVLCGVLRKKITNRTSIIDFREWRQPFSVVMKKLVVEAGWIPQLEPGRVSLIDTEVSHATTH